MGGSVGGRHLLRSRASVVYGGWQVRLSYMRGKGPTPDPGVG